MIGPSRLQVGLSPGGGCAWVFVCCQPCCVACQDGDARPIIRYFGVVVSSVAAATRLLSHYEVAFDFERRQYIQHEIIGYDFTCQTEPEKQCTSETESLGRGLQPYLISPRNRIFCDINTQGPLPLLGRRRHIDFYLTTVVSFERYSARLHIIRVGQSAACFY